MAPLPDVRNTTYAAGSQVKSVDLNDVQDCIIVGKHGNLEIAFAAAMAHPESYSNTPLLSESGNYWSNASGEFSLQLPLPVIPGDIIKAVKANVRDLTSLPVTMKLYKVNVEDGTTTQIGSSVVSSGAQTNQELALTGLTETVAATRAYYMRITVPGGGGRFYGGRLIKSKTT